MEPKEDDAGRDAQTIDATPLLYAPIDDLYEAVARVPRSSSFHQLLVKVIRMVAAELTLQAALADAMGVNRFEIRMDAQDARERSRDLLEMLSRLDGKAAHGS